MNINALNSTGATPEPAANEETKYMVEIPVPYPLSITLAGLQQAYRSQRGHITIVHHITIIAPRYAAIGPEQATLQAWKPPSSSGASSKRLNLRLTAVEIGVVHQNAPGSPLATSNGPEIRQRIAVI